MLALLQRTVDPNIVDCTAKLIKISATPAKVYRVKLSDAPDHFGASSVIVKIIDPDWPGDPHGAEREWRFYRDIFPQLDLARPVIYFSGLDPESNRRVIVMEDAATDYRFPSAQHTWTEGEARCVLRAYARLHVAAEHCLPPENKRDWLWRMALHSQEWPEEELLKLGHDLTSWGIWPELPGLGGLIHGTVQAMQAFTAGTATLLHNDVTPANAPLPHNLEGEALLLDWEMAGWGMAELDLAFMFMQPFRSERAIDKQAALDFYWDQRYALDGRRPPKQERKAAQIHAEALWALSLIPVAHKMAVHPHPPGSSPALYWQSMHCIVAERLQQLSTD